MKHYIHLSLNWLSDLHTRIHFLNTRLNSWASEKTFNSTIIATIWLLTFCTCHYFSNSSKSNSFPRHLHIKSYCTEKWDLRENDLNVPLPVFRFSSEGNGEQLAWTWVQMQHTKTHTFIGWYIGPFQREGQRHPSLDNRWPPSLGLKTCLDSTPTTAAKPKW